MPLCQLNKFYVPNVGALAQCSMRTHCRVYEAFRLYSRGQVQLIRSSEKKVTIGGTEVVDGNTPENSFSFHTLTMSLKATAISFARGGQLFCPALRP